MGRHDRVLHFSACKNRYNHEFHTALHTRSVSSIILVGILLSSPHVAAGQESSRADRAAGVIEHEGREFAAYVDAKTGTPSWIIDVDSLDFGLGETILLTTEAQVADASRAFLDAYADAFGIHPQHLLLERVATDSNLWFIGYSQVHDGIPVANAEVGLTVTRDGSLVAAGVKAFPDVEVDIRARVPVQAAVQAARAHGNLSSAKLGGTPDLIILPVELNDRYTYRLAWRVRLDEISADRSGSKIYFIDAHDEHVIADYDNVLDHSLGYDQDDSVSDDRTIRQGGYLSVGPAIVSSESREYEEVKVEASGSNSVWGYVKLNFYESPDDYTDPLDRYVDQPFPAPKSR